MSIQGVPLAGMRIYYPRPVETLYTGGLNIFRKHYSTRLTSHYYENFTYVNDVYDNNIYVIVTKKKKMFLYYLIWTEFFTFHTISEKVTNKQIQLRQIADRVLRQSRHLQNIMLTTPLHLSIHLSNIMSQTIQQPHSVQHKKNIPKNLDSRCIDVCFNNYTTVLNLSFSLVTSTFKQDYDYAIHRVALVCFFTPQQNKAKVKSVKTNEE